MDYLNYLETVWSYVPYILYTFVIVTFLPKSLSKIKRFADADYEANRYNYHRCYGPDKCCHKLAATSSSNDEQQQKQRKAVRRVYPKRQIAEAAATSAANASEAIKRQVQVSAIQTQTNVNQIARMFETGGAGQPANTVASTTTTTTTTVAAAGVTGHNSVLRKVNRVQPTPVLPEIRTPRQADEETPAPPSKRLENMARSHLTQLLLQQEERENSANLLNQLNAEQQCREAAADEENESWSQAFYAAQETRTKRSIPTTLNLNSGSVSSATPSTTSPHSSAAASPLSTSPATQPLHSPVLLRPQLNLKSSLEDIFAAIARNAEKNDNNFIYAGCKTLSPVTSIDDILQQRRLSRPLSAYSISDLLNDDSAAAAAGAGMDEQYVENFLRALNKT